MTHAITVAYIYIVILWQADSKVTTAIREKLVASLVPVHEATEKAVNKRWKFEERVSQAFDIIERVLLWFYPTFYKKLDKEIKFLQSNLLLGSNKSDEIFLISIIVMHKVIISIFYLMLPPSALTACCKRLEIR